MTDGVLLSMACHDEKRRKGDLVGVGCDDGKDGSAGVLLVPGLRAKLDETIHLIVGCIG